MKIASNKIILLPVMLLCFALGAGNVDWLIAEKDKQNHGKRKACRGVVGLPDRI